jgi:hypothetical protein
VSFELAVNDIFQELTFAQGVLEEPANQDLFEFLKDSRRLLSVAPSQIKRII